MTEWDVIGDFLEQNGYPEWATKVRARKGQRKLDPNRPMVPDVLPLALTYRARMEEGKSGWWPLRNVLDDDNVDDASIRQAMARAEAEAHMDGVELCEKLLAMSMTGRRKVAFQSRSMDADDGGEAGDDSGSVMVARQPCPGCGIMRVGRISDPGPEPTYPMSRCPDCSGLVWLG